MHEKVAAAIDEYIRPLIEADGGHIELIEASATRVVVRLSGMCAGCPGQPFTVTRVIEPALKRALGTTIEVEARFSADP